MVSDPIAVLGGGNGGHYMAADLTLAGCKVNFFEHPQFESSFKATLQSKTVEIAGVGKIRIHKVTTDIAVALSDANIIMVVVPSHGQELFFNNMIPHLKDGQIVAILTGNFGSLRLKKLLANIEPNRKVTICETNTLPFGVRLVGPAKVEAIYSYGQKRKSIIAPMRFLFSALPATDTNAIYDEFKKLYPVFSPAKNVLEVALSNPNIVLHPLPLLLNVGRVENPIGEFYMYRQGITSSVLKAQANLSNEITEVGKTFHVEAAAFQEFFPAAMEHLIGNGGSFANFLAPKFVKHRYLTEDVPYGLVPMCELAKIGSVMTPLTSALISLTSVLCEEDYYKTGRTMKTLGLEGLCKSEVINLVEGKADR